MRIRITFSKSGALIYTGNLDIHTIWERAARRAGLPLKYSRGFHPQPKIIVAAPLPLGFESDCELLDMRLDGETDAEVLATRLNSALPGGIRVLSVKKVDDREPALPTRVTSADYEVEVGAGMEEDELNGRVQQLLSTQNFPRERRGKHYDLRPLIEELRVLPQAGDARMHMRLRSQPGSTGRPEEVLEALHIARENARIRRTALHLGALSSESPKNLKHK